MVGDTAHISLVRCVDLDDNVYDLTKVVSEKSTKTEHGREQILGTIEFYHKGQLVDWRDDGSFDVIINGERINVREISPD